MNQDRLHEAVLMAQNISVTEIIQKPILKDFINVLCIFQSCGFPIFLLTQPHPLNAFVHTLMYLFTKCTHTLLPIYSVFIKITLSYFQINRNSVFFPHPVDHLDPYLRIPRMLTLSRCSIKCA